MLTMSNKFDFIDKKVKDFLKNNPSKIGSMKTNKAFVSELKKEVEILKDCILKFTNSNSVKQSIEIKEYKNGGLVITFNQERATKPSYFQQFTDYPANAYMPLLRNEGYEIKNPKWKSFFGKGGSGKAENFIEKGIEEYHKKRGNSLSIEVVKNYDIRYSKSSKTITKYSTYRNK